MFIGSASASRQVAQERSSKLRKVYVIFGVADGLVGYKVAKGQVAKLQIGQAKVQKRG